VENNDKTESEDVETGIPDDNKEISGLTESTDLNDVDLILNVDEYQGFDLDPKLREDDQVLLEASQEGFLRLFYKNPMIIFQAIWLLLMSILAAQSSQCQRHLLQIFRILI
jgi:hypothetical protein